jgi:hypothetical protein
VARISRERVVFPHRLGTGAQPVQQSDQAPQCSLVVWRDDHCPVPPLRCGSVVTAVFSPLGQRPRRGGRAFPEPPALPVHPAQPPITHYRAIIVLRR